MAQLYFEYKQIKSFTCATYNSEFIEHLKQLKQKLFVVVLDLQYLPVINRRTQGI